MPTSTDLNALRLQREQLKSELAQIGDMRPGSLVPRFRKCGKPNCHCSKKGSKGNSPSYSLTHPIAGKTMTKSFRQVRALTAPVNNWTNIIDSAA